MWVLSCKMWGLSCSHGTKIMSSHPAPQNLTRSSSPSYGLSSRFRGLILPLVCFPLCHVWKTVRHWVPCSSWSSCWAKSGFPTSSPTISWLNHMGCFPLPCLGPLGSSWLRHHWSLSQDTHPPALRAKFCWACGFSWNAQSPRSSGNLIPEQEDLCRQIPTTRTSISLQALKLARDSGFLQLLSAVHSWQEVEIQVCRT